jgi:dinuclear metal center YbgI/SA1388 family protein
LLVHHGLFWKGDDMRVIGPRRRRLALLLAHDVNLMAYHLPLDAHAQLGNNAQLGQRLGLVATQHFGEQEIGCAGDLVTPVTARLFAASVEDALGRPPLVVGDGEREVRRIGWCTGGAQGHFEAAIAAGCDLYLSGEISEQTTHLARESGVPYIAAGHHATERYGVQAVGRHIATRFGILHQHIDIDNPV